MSQQINLYDPGFRRRAQALSAATMLVAVVVTMAGMLAYAAYARQQVAQSEAQVEHVNAELKTMRERLAKALADAQRGQSKGLQDEVARAEARARNRQDLIEKLRGGALGNSQGFSKYLAALARQTTEGVWLTGVTVEGAAANFVIQGRMLRADLLPGYIRMLSREEALHGKQISEMKLAEQDAQPNAAAAKAPAVAGAAQDPQAERSAKPAFVEFSIGSGGATSGGAAGG